MTYCNPKNTIIFRTKGLRNATIRGGNGSSNGRTIIFRTKGLRNATWIPLLINSPLVALSYSEQRD